MKKLILSLIVLLSILLTSCESSTNKIQEQKNIKYKIFDNTGSSWETTSYTDWGNNVVTFKVKDGTKVVISGNYTIEQIK